MAKAVAYRRVSTREQGTSGLGLEAQAHSITALAAKLELPVIWFEDVGVSGGVSFEKRPGLMGALNALNRGDALVVHKRDRVARDTFISILVEREVGRRGARIVSTAGEGTDSHEPAAVFTRRILDAVAELEKSLIAARTSAALQAKKRRGERVGGIPRGFQVGPDGGRLVVHEGEQAIIARMRTLRTWGWSQRATADQLTAEGFTTRRGSRIRFQYVQSLEMSGDRFVVSTA